MVHLSRSGRTTNSLWTSCRFRAAYEQPLPRLPPCPSSPSYLGRQLSWAASVCCRASPDPSMVSICSLERESSDQAFLNPRISGKSAAATVRRIASSSLPRFLRTLRRSRAARASVPLHGQGGSFTTNSEPAANFHTFSASSAATAPEPVSTRTRFEPGRRRRCPPSR
jgi:hypothetical protein